MAEEHVFLVRVLVRRAPGFRNARVVAVHVCAERVGNHAGVERDTRHLVAEVRAVADVGLEAHGERLLDDRVQLALAVDEAAGMARERVRDDVAGFQQRHHLLEDGVGIHAVRARLRQRPELAEVDVERQVGTPGDFRRQADHLDAPARETAQLRVRLEALYDVEVLERALHRGFDVHAVRLVQRRVVVAFHAAHEVGREEGEAAALLRVDHILPERGQRHARRAALVDERGDAGAHAAEVRLQAEATGDVLEHVRVGVDEARQHQLAGDIHRFLGAGGRDGGQDRGDAAVLDRDIVDAVDILGRIDDPATAQ